MPFAGRALARGCVQHRQGYRCALGNVLELHSVMKLVPYQHGIPFLKGLQEGRTGHDAAPALFLSEKGRAREQGCYGK